MPGGPGPFRLKLSHDAKAALDGLKGRDKPRWKRVTKALRFLKNDPHHPGLEAHKWDILRGRALGGGDIWTAYVENNTPSAWRIFYYYDATERGVIHVAWIEPHS